MKSSINIYTNARTIRQKLASMGKSTTLLERDMTIEEFEKRAQLFKGRHFLDEDSRHILLKEAADFEEFSLLKIERDFLRFIKSSPSLLRFFEELSKEKVTFASLNSADTYAEYEHHLTILERLYERYLVILEHNSAVDAINAPLIYTINSAYLNSLSSIALYFDGYMTRYEIALFEKIAQETNVTLYFSTSGYTHKMHERFSGFSLEPWNHYELSLTNKKTVACKNYQSSYAIKNYESPSRLLQVASIKLAIEELIADGCHPDNIAVVLPDEKFVPYLKYFDYEKNFNYAMGGSFKETILFQTLQAIYLYRSEQNSENFLRLKRFMLEEKTLLHEWHHIYSSAMFVETMKHFESRLKIDEERFRFLELLHQFEKLDRVLEGYTFSELFHLFLTRLSEVSLESVGGGKITVMGLLETRGVSFDGVIVVDFNEGFAPKMSNKDLYLNSAIRYHAALPTRSDRLGLQMDYYHKLFMSAKKVVLSYVRNEELSPSPFYELMKLPKSSTVIDNRYFKYLTNLHTQVGYSVPVIKESINLLSSPLSATKLKAYIECKRRFYYHYILKLKAPELPSDTLPEYKMGTILHDALQNLYTKHRRLTDKEALKVLLHQEIKLLITSDLFTLFQTDVWLQKLDAFITLEVERFEAGFEVLLCEESFSFMYDGVELVGKIDRVDRDTKENNRVSVIDYKSGSFPIYTEKNIATGSDFQLLFYAMAATSYGDVEGAYYYDLGKGELIRAHYLEEQKSYLSEKINVMRQPEQNFELCEDKSKCRYCDYQVLCERL
jgi:ATP-dependent helicase/nuclease subunit B